MKHPDRFVQRHLGYNPQEVKEMLNAVGVSSMDELIRQTVPDSIRLQSEMNLPDDLSEADYLKELKGIASLNKVFRNYIGVGYYDTITPSVILRNVFENPGWYTQYTPYQAEISQGRLEALLNFQTMVSDLTGLPVANASLLDEATAAAEAMFMFFNRKNQRAKADNIANVFLVSDKCFPQTIDVLYTRASGVGIEIKISADLENDISAKVFGALVQYPDVNGSVSDFRSLVGKLHAQDSYLVAATDLMALALLTPPGEWGADAAVGSAQRFGVPMGFGGPHAAFFSVSAEFMRLIPGRIIGVSIDNNGNRALRMALQTREQHIRRDKATSNICTAQALLAIMASMYAVYHGPDTIRRIATRLHTYTTVLAHTLQGLGIKVLNKNWFDTLTLEMSEAQVAELRRIAEKLKINFYYSAKTKVSVSLDETTNETDVNHLIGIFAAAIGKMLPAVATSIQEAKISLSKDLLRTSEYLTHPVFNSHHSETAMMRYIKYLEGKDLSLTQSMIPLGSCTMKLNAATELIPVSWPEFNKIHPFAPVNQTKGYQKMIEELGRFLCEVTGFAGVSFQPNSGAQGEYAGLLVIREYHEQRGDKHRDIILIPSSAHGTNPASAAIAGFKIVVTKTAADGTIDVEDFRAKAIQYKETLAGAMITYPSTHGVFEDTIKELADIIHDNGGQFYMDGANMNAQVGLTSPAIIGADVCHLNLHKTFAIPHGGGGPGMGPICVAKHLVPYLPGHKLVKTGGNKAISAVSAAPYGSTSILLISYAYCKMLGKDGLRKATEYAILSANYLKARLEEKYKVLYANDNNRVAHEFILDLREFKASTGLETDDIVKRLIDYSFHAPTVSFPVAGTIMIEPTESEPKEELDRFVEAMLSIRQEIEEVKLGIADANDNVLKNSPHTLSVVCGDEWNHKYPREKAAFPVPYLKKFKFWSSVARVDNAYGDRNIICTCPPIESYEMA
ncbi:MAG: aminomethyl-transferring glycine dehydrogenase [Bacteroidia bacterium]|nr:aminomethyl-transferring glycine dehydrogenase [Bacteroidia bacterium]